MNFDKRDRYGALLEDIQKALDYTASGYESVYTSKLDNSKIRLSWILLAAIHRIQRCDTPPEDLNKKYIINEETFTGSFDAFGQPINKNDMLLNFGSPMVDQNIICFKVTHSTKYYSKDGSLVYLNSITASNIDGDEQADLQTSYFVKPEDHAIHSNLIVYNPKHFEFVNYFAD